MNEPADARPSSDSSTTGSSTPAKATAVVPNKPRNPVERVIVWGAILAMLVIVSIEAYAKFSYDATFESLKQAISDAEAKGEELSGAKLDELISGSPSRTETDVPTRYDNQKKEIDLQWFSMFKTYRIVVHLSAVEVGGDLVVTRFDTDTPPEEEPVIASGDAGSSEPVMMAPGGMAPTRDVGGPQGEHGGPAGGPGSLQFSPPSFEDLDADADGQLSAEELPEFLRERFADIDTDEDDAISAEEFENRPRRGQGGGGAPGETATPDRPELETPESETDT